jgi:DNA (cytosine-5)-methyltransferase 1
LFFVAESVDYAASARQQPARGGPEIEARDEARMRGPERGRTTGELADTDGRNAGAEGLQRSGEHGQQQEDGGAHRRLEDAECPEGARLGQHGGARVRFQEAAGLTGSGGCGGWWRDADWIWCADQKYRPVEPGTFPLAHGVAARVGRLRAYGNAIVAPAAEAFIQAYREARGY